MYLSDKYIGRIDFMNLDWPFCDKIGTKTYEQPAGILLHIVVFHVEQVIEFCIYIIVICTCR